MKARIPSFFEDIIDAFPRTLLLATTFLVLPQVLTAQELVDRVVVSIEGEPITQREILRFAAGQGKDVASLSLDSPELQQVKQELIVQRLLDKEAEALDISVSNEEIEAYLSEIRRQNAMDEEGFKRLLEQKGIDWEVYLSQVRSDILKNRVVSARVRAKVNVVDEDIQRYLESQPALKPELGTRRVLLLNLAEEPGTAAKEVEMLRTAVAEAEEPALLLLEKGAKDLGYVKQEDLRDTIADALSQTTDGSFSPVVEVDGQRVVYYAVGTITDDNPVDPILAKEVSVRVYEKKFTDKLSEFIDAELPKRYHVEQL